MRHILHQRAECCDSPEAKAKFCETARQYADSALQIDDPAAWCAKHSDDANPRKKHA
jgi:hypothetical protein